MNDYFPLHIINIVVVQLDYPHGQQMVDGQTHPDYFEYKQHISEIWSLLWIRMEKSPIKY